MKNLFYRLVEFAQRRVWLIIAGVGVITVFFGWFAAHVTPTPDLILVPEDPEVSRLTEKYGSANLSADFLILTAQSPEISTPRVLGLLYDAYDRLARLPHVKPGLTPFNFPGFKNEGGRLGFGAMAEGGRPPTTPEAAIRFCERLAANPLARNLVISSDGSMLAAYLPVDAGDDYRPLLRQAEAAIAPLAGVIDVHIAGFVPMGAAILDHIYGDLPIFLAAALAIILLADFLSFRTLRSLILPVLVVVLGMIWTVGTLALLGYKLSVIMIMTPPLVLILGSSYSLHMLNQYYRDTRGLARGSRERIVQSVARVAITIFLASITTVFGFVSLLTASLRQVREFGVATGIGISYCALLALFFLPAVLSLLRAPIPRQTDRVREGALARLLSRLAQLIIRGRWAVIGASVLVVAGFCIALPAIRYESNLLRYFRRREPAVKNFQRLIDSFTGFQVVHLTLNAPTGSSGYFLDPAVLAVVAQLEDRIAADPDVKYTLSFNSFLRNMTEAMSHTSEAPKSRVPVIVLLRYMTAFSATPIGETIAGETLSRDGERYTITIHVWDHVNRTLAFEDQMSRILPRIRDMADRVLPSGVQSEFWGAAVTVVSTSRILARNQLSSIVISAALVFALAALIFRSVIHGLLVLAPLALGIMLDFILMAIFSIKLDVVTTAFASIAIGIGIDNAMHFVIWYRRQLRLHPRDPATVILQTMKIAGRPMVLTSASIAVALLVFMFSTFRPVMNFGILLAMSLVLTTLGALTILPTLLYFEAGKKGHRATRGPSRRAAAAPRKRVLPGQRTIE